MNMFKAINICLAAVFVLGTVQADDRPAISNDSWEQRPEGIAVAMMLIHWTDNGHQRDAINVYVKNTSGEIKAVFSNGRDDGIHISYIDTNNHKIPLHHYAAYGFEESVHRPHELKTGEILIRTLEVNSDDLSHIKSSLVGCTFRIYIPSTKSVLEIETTPKMLANGTGEIAEGNEYTLPHK